MQNAPRIRGWWTSREEERRKQGGRQGATRPLISTYRYRSTKLPSSIPAYAAVLSLTRSGGLKLAENEFGSYQELSQRKNDYYEKIESCVKYKVNVVTYNLVLFNLFNSILGMYWNIDVESITLLLLNVQIVQKEHVYITRDFT